MCACQSSNSRRNATLLGWFRTLHIKESLQASAAARRGTGELSGRTSGTRKKKLSLFGLVSYFIVGLKLRGLRVSADMEPLTFVKPVTTRSHNLKRLVGPSWSAGVPPLDKHVWNCGVNVELTPLETDLLRPTGASLFSVSLLNPRKTF